MKSIKKLSEDVVRYSISTGCSQLAGRSDSFAVVAVRCNDIESTGKKKLKEGLIYYLLDGYDVETGEKVNQKRDGIDVLYDDYIDADNTFTPHVIVSAVVGQNGSGKSSLVEFMLRIINNLAAATFGELPGDTYPERLHFIEGVKGDLWFEKDNKIHRLHVEDQLVEIYRVEENGGKYGKEPIYSSAQIFNHNIGFKDLFYRLSDNALKKIFDDFFYTVVTNHSLYAYNTKDFENENDSESKVEYLRGQLKRKDEKAQRPTDINWLNGLFHKNDGYQIPLVLTPSRHNGNIDVNTENSLAKERLISILIENENFRTINGHMEVESLSLEHLKKKDYGFTYLREVFEMKNLTQEGYDLLRKRILNRWAEILELDIPYKSDKPYYELALNYLTYKTIKVAAKYRQHNAPFLKFRDFKGGFIAQLVDDIVNSEAEDFSHITRKIFQTLAYIIGDVYSTLLKADSISNVNFKDIVPDLTKDIKKLSLNNESKSMLIPYVETQAKFPPPFLDSKINLCEKSDKRVKIDFESLSSGERQLAYAVSSILYHLDNLNSVENDNSDILRIPYKNVFIVLEEVELYFHPELQQGLLKNILDGIKQMLLSQIKGIHILFVTHSPYVLSDIPKQNVLALENNCMPSKKKLNTFCANIHELLEDSFFLSGGSQGFLAQWEVGRLMACIKVHQAHYSYKKRNKRFVSLKAMLANESNKEETRPIYRALISRYPYTRTVNEDRLHYANFCQDFSFDQMKERIALIDEPVIRSVLEHELNTAFAMNRELRLMRIEELEQEARRLREME